MLLTAFVVEIELDDEKYLLSSPAAVFVPTGVRHLFRLFRYRSMTALATVVAIVRSREYITHLIKSLD